MEHGSSGSQNKTCQASLFLHCRIISAVRLRGMKIHALGLELCFSFNVTQGMSYGSLCYSRARNCTSWNCQFGGGCLMSSPSSPFWNKRKWPLACGTCAQWLKERNLCRQGRRAVCCGNAAGAVCGQVYACGTVHRTSPFLLNESRLLCSARCYLSNNTRFSLEIYVCLKDLKKLCLVGERQTNFPFNTRDSWLRSKTLVLGSSWKYVKSSKIQCQEKNRQQTKKKRLL